MKISHKYNKWVTPQLRALRTSRDKAYVASVTYRDPHIKARYHDLRRKFSNEISTAKKVHVSELITEAQKAKTPWKELRKLGVTKRSLPPPNFDRNVLNKYYASVVNSSAPITQADYDYLISTRKDCLDIPEFSLKQVTQKEVIAAIAAASSKGVGEDAISVEMLKLAGNRIVPFLTSLFNKSIQNSHFPTTWTRTLLRPLSKIKDPKTVSDTRPIAQLPEISKILERLVHSQLLNHLEKHTILDPRQAGFRGQHSTETALLGVLDEVRKAI